ncbi:hypothetical protein BDN72DRAFT_631304 [Pluteus cervinus]|uniref:Uncharacterized protein n=1 Tax=Pluteus cervinus TaxID=181527 RepID=A0ACD3BAB3_9AGAR|nr:hypothetical protein BDN72DRAFT_631304 [Pluteus cervinus]
MATASPPHSRVPSPPRTPLSAVGTTSSSSPPSDDSSIIDEVSFDFSFDQHGNYVRSSKGSAKSTNSSPPTPQDHPLAPADPPVKPPSPILLNSPVRRSSLSRSESAFPILVGASERANAPRQFTRVASGPINPPATASTALSAVKPRPLPRRVGLDDVRPELQHRSRSTDSHHHDEKENELEETPYLKRGSPPLSARLMTSSRVQLQARSSASMAVRSLADSAARNNPHSRQIMPAPSRAGRIPKTSMNTAAAAASALSTIQSRYALNSASAANGAGFDRISEADCNESDGGENPQPEHERDRGGDTDPEDDPAGVAGLNMRHRSQAIIPSNFNQSTSRPRRSMSLSDALQAPPEEQQYQYISQPAPAHQHQHQQPYQRPGTSQGLVPEERGEGRSEHRRSRIEESERQYRPSGVI